MKLKLTGVIILLIVIIAVLAYINKDTLVEKQQLNNDAIFVVLDKGNEIASYNMDQIITFGENKFKANLKADGKESVEYEYTGVLLKAILEDAGVEFDGKETAIISAIDGYVVAVSIEKLMEDDNVYLAFKREGDWLATREEGGRGPYQMIIRKDKFSQYWCKYAYSVELN